jgi:excisionase family DNA binding protein
MREKEERDLRVHEFAARSGYQVSTIRKKLLQREIGYRKCGRLVLIPESELQRIRGPYLPPVIAGNAR